MARHELERDAAAPEEEETESALREDAIERQPEPQPIAPEGDRALGLGSMDDDVVDREAPIGLGRRLAVSRRRGQDAEAVEGVGLGRPACVVSRRAKPHRVHARVPGLELHRTASELKAPRSTSEAGRLHAEEEHVGGSGLGQVRGADLNAVELHGPEDCLT